MGAELVEGHDLRVVAGRIAMRTTQGYRPIDVLYRRVDDDYLAPLNFRPDSLLGLPGIWDVYRAGGITIANPPGTGNADDTAPSTPNPHLYASSSTQPRVLPTSPTSPLSAPHHPPPEAPP